MDVRVNNLNSNVHLTDARAMLTPDLLQQIAEAVMQQIREMERQEQQREDDMRILDLD